jgi:hypothetical protein
MFSDMLSLIDSLFLSLYKFVGEYCLVMTFSAGLAIPLALESKGLETIAGRMALFASGITLTFGPVGYFLIPWSLKFWFGERLDSVPYYENVSGWLVLGGFAGSLFGYFLLRRYCSPALNEIKHKITRRTNLERNKRTDIRTISDVLPKKLRDYDAAKHINLKKGVFIGLGEDGKPSYIPLEKWQKSHAQIIGTTGAGKGVVSTLLLAQSVEAGEAVFVADPKNDEWAPHVLRSVCEKHNKPFYLVDLNADEYQLDFLCNMTASELEELLIAGFSLAEKGEAADFYRIEDRRAARVVSHLVKEGETIRSLFSHETTQALANKAAGFFGKLEELALMNSINAVGGLDLSEVVNSGGCVYLIGSMRNSRVIMMQRMLMVRLIQLAERRDRVTTIPRPVALFLDEFKYHISKPALEGLGAARDKGVHILMAHQSLADLHDCPADISGDAVQGAVVENSNIKIVYKLKDPQTAEWMARMSGSILVDDEVRRARQTSGFAEILDDERTIRQAERYFIDENMLLSLPPSCAFVYGGKLPTSSYIKPIKVEKRPIEKYLAPNQEQYEFNPLAGLDEPEEPEQLDPLAGLDEPEEPEQLDPLAGLDEPVPAMDLAEVERDLVVLPKESKADPLAGLDDLEETRC